MVEAAERRQQEQSSRGIKDPESVKRMQQKSLETQRLEREQAFSGQTNLRWTQE